MYSKDLTYISWSRHFSTYQEHILDRALFISHVTLIFSAYAATEANLQGKYFHIIIYVFKIKHQGNKMLIQFKPILRSVRKQL